MKPNQIICGDALAVLADLPEDSIDLVVFSPPYDNLRDYNGYKLDLHQLGKSLFRVTKSGGVVVMVIQDQTIGGRKTLTSFRTILDWCDRIGFALFECSIYQKQGKDGAWWAKRFRVDHEYMPIFVKGGKPNTFCKDAVKIPCKHAGKTMNGGANRNRNGKTVDSRPLLINPTKCPGTIWNYANGGDKVALKRAHPAAFPDKIPYDFIRVFTRKGDWVLDPMVGSGSTAIAAHLLGRRYIGVDISEEYCELARQRIANNQSNIVPGFKNISPLRSV
ncbi:MAG: DNA-methyltransferase [Gammaproteobacteria bacterium]